MKISEMGLRIIKNFEGFSPIVYVCPAGWRTIGYGHALKKGEDDKFKVGISEAEASEILEKDVVSAEQSVGRLITVELTQGQFDALVSFTFNLGGGALQRSTLRSRLNRGEYLEASAEFPKWVWGGGRKLPGLIKRRKAEQTLFNIGVLLL